MKKGRFSVSEMAFIKKAVDNMTVDDISRELDRDPASVHSWIETNVGFSTSQKKEVEVHQELKGKPYYRGKVYPDIPLSVTDVYVITNVGDRLDSLAYSYYNDTNYWWIISTANNNVTKGSLFPAPGTQLRIPTDLNYVLNLFDQFNQVR